MVVLIKIFQRAEPIYTHTYTHLRFIIGICSCDYGGQKFHDLPSASWRTWKANGIIQLESKGPRTRRANI